MHYHHLMMGQSAKDGLAAVNQLPIVYHHHCPLGYGVSVSMHCTELLTKDSSSRPGLECIILLAAVFTADVAAMTNYCLPPTRVRG